MAAATLAALAASTPPMSPRWRCQQPNFLGASNPSTR
jgi:hypothetical protein